MVRESFDIHFIIEKFPAILSALPVTLEITAVTLVLSWLLGLLVAWGKVSGSGWRISFAESPQLSFCTLYTLVFRSLSMYPTGRKSALWCWL